MLSSPPSVAQPQRAAHRRPAERAVRAAERVAALDMLRGLALCGILLIHIAAFAHPGAPPGFGYTGPLLDEVALAGLILFIESKFFCLFALLFGVGFAVQRDSAERRGVEFAPRFRRRLAILALIGAAHIALLWEGDILLLYAALGLLLVPARDLPPSRLVRRATWLVAVPLLIVGVAFAGLFLAQLHPASAARIQAGEAQFTSAFAASSAWIAQRYASDDFLAAAIGRVQSYLAGLPLMSVRAPVVLAMFLIGFAIGRSGLLRDLDGNLPLLRRVRTWGLSVGLVASALITLAYTQLSPFAAFTALGLNQVFAGPVLALGYAAGFVLLLRRPRVARLLAPLGDYGRVALSVYLLQSALLGLLFYGYGLGLQVAPHQALLIGLALNLLLIVVARLWLHHFRMGPVEWLWRTLTDGRAQPMLRQEPSAAGRAPGAGAGSAPTAASRRGTGSAGPTATGSR